MKNIFTLFLLAGFSLTLFAQQKTSVGVVAKSGTFTLPKRETNAVKADYFFPAGFSASVGFFASRRLGKRFDLTGELLFTYARYERRRSFESSVYSATYSFYWDGQTKRFEAWNISLPISLHCRLREDGKASLFLGTALNYFSIVSQRTTYTLDSEALHVETGFQRPIYKDGFQVFLTAGTQYRLSPRTAVGFEFAGTLKPPPLDVDCESCDYIARPQFWMRSLTVSVRHSILQE
jgi:hypothetical protein